MSRSSTRILQQAIDGISVTASIAQSELLTASSSNASVSEVVVLSGPVNVYGVSISNISGGASSFTLGDSTSTNVIVLGSIPNTGARNLTLSPNFVTFTTDVRILRENTGNFFWTILYQ